VKFGLEKNLKRFLLSVHELWLGKELRKIGFIRTSNYDVNKYRNMIN
jgi:hypothetical protein